MKKLFKDRVLPFVCTLSILVSLCIVPVSAGNFGGQIELEYPVIEPSAFFDQGLLESEFNRLFGDNSADHCAFFSEFAYIANKDNWSQTSKENLVNLAAQWNMNYGVQYSSTAIVDTHTLDDGTEVDFIRVKISDSRLGGSRDNWSWCLNDGAGKILVHVIESDDGAANTGQWVPIGYMGKGSFRMMSYDALYNLADDVGGKLIKYNNFYCIKKSSTSAVGDLVYANADGKPYVTPYESDKWASNQDRPTTSAKDEVGEIVEGVIEGLTPGINLDNMTVTLPDGTVNIIDELIYDESTKSYTIDSHDTYNTENNYYYEWNYEWNYYINFTSITYIGQTEQYDKYYEVYYELPDGRDSADLSKEDLEQLNLSIDVIPYGRSADDTSLRSLYHFDGDTKDSSYWNYCTDFTWNKGASLTYMEAGAFEGALYLDETDHEFSVLLPSPIGTGDFTVQFRYYQSHTLAPALDSYVKFGDATLLGLNGSTYCNGSGAAIEYVSTGVWNEVAIVRTSGTLYYYVNGVCAGTLANTSYLSDNLVFIFGSSQQTYKYFDELRVLNYAIAAGDNYTPTSVPHDTNLTLVLPDTAVPVADEYWQITSSGTNMFQYNMADGKAKGFPGISTKHDIGYQRGTTESWESLYSLNSNSTAFAFPKWGVNQNYVSTVVNRDSVTFTASNSHLFGNASITNTNGKLVDSNYYWIGSALSTLVAFASHTAEGWTSYLSNGDYNLAVVMEDGSIVNYRFSLKNGVPRYTRVDSYDWGSIGIAYAASGTSSNTNAAYYLYIQPKANQPLTIRHIELLNATSTDLKAEFVSSIVPIDKDSLNTPTLAVRTDEEITSHIIGGPRPSLPEKGMVWALVENERITSLQVYNGQAWEAVDGRIWTGQRWVPYNAYNIITLQDMYDIVDATPDFEYIYSESGFWTWWQKSWNAFQERLFKALESGGGSGGATLDPETAPTVPSDPDTGEEGYTILELFVVLKDGTWKLISGVVSTAYDGFSGFVQTVSDAGSFFDFYDSDSEESIFFIPLEEGETIWD